MGHALRQPDFDPHLPTVGGLCRSAAHGARPGAGRPDGDPRSGPEPGGGARRDGLGEYFIYFSFFLMVSALLLTGLFFKLGIEQRTREIGVLRALGFSAAKIRGMFLLEGAVLAVAGAAMGVGAALAYGALILLGLRSWWIGAVGTRLLSLHASVPALAIGAAAGMLAGLGSVAWTLRGLQPVTPRGLLAGSGRAADCASRWMAGTVAAVLAAALVVERYSANWTRPPVSSALARCCSSRLCCSNRSGCMRAGFGPSAGWSRWACAACDTVPAAAFCALP